MEFRVFWCNCLKYFETDYLKNVIAKNSDIWPYIKLYNIVRIKGGIMHTRGVLVLFHISNTTHDML